MMTRKLYFEGRKLDYERGGLFLERKFYDDKKV